MAKSRCEEDKGREEEVCREDEESIGKAAATCILKKSTLYRTGNIIVSDTTKTTKSHEETRATPYPIPIPAHTANTL